MDKYSKLGGEDAIARTNAEVALEEEQRLGTPPDLSKPPKRLNLGHLTLLQTLPDCVFIHKTPSEDIPDIVA